VLELAPNGIAADAFSFTLTEKTKSMNNLCRCGLSGRDSDDGSVMGDGVLGFQTFSRVRTVMKTLSFLN
jgi:hypothetical protein